MLRQLPARARLLRAAQAARLRRGRGVGGEGREGTARPRRREHAPRKATASGAVAPMRDGPDAAGGSVLRGRAVWRLGTCNKGTCGLFFTPGVSGRRPRSSPLESLRTRTLSLTATAREAAGERAERDGPRGAQGQ